MKFKRINIKRIPKALQARACALQLVLDVTLSGQSLAHIQDGLVSQLTPQDRGFTNELVLGTLRHKSALNLWVNQRLEKPIRPKDQWLNVMLELGVYQLVYLDMPPHAVIHSMVELVKVIGFPQLSGLMNGLLRRVAREVEMPERQVLFKDKPGLPQWLEASIRKDWPDHWREVLAGVKHPAPFFLRVNHRAVQLDDYLQALKDEHIQFDQLPEEDQVIQALVPWAVHVSLNGPVSQLPFYERGGFSVQDLSAQLAVALLLDKAKPAEGQSWLDACAAPGGKTSYLLEHLDPSIQLDVLDSQSNRLERLQENLKRLKLNRDGVNLICKDLLDHQGSYDVILLDAPCSGTGVLKRHPDIAWCRRPSDIQVLVDLQQALMHRSFEMLKPGGILFYTTCSLLRIENSDNIAHFIEEQGHQLEMIDLPESLGLKESYGVQRLPGVVSSDGFYYCMVQKKS